MNTLRENDIKIKTRLRKLRTDREYSQTELGKLVKDIIGDEMELSGETGKQTISQIESLKNKRMINLSMAKAYCKIFDTTLDYIFCQTGDMKPSNMTLKSELGLNDDTLRCLTSVKAYKDKADKNPNDYKYGYEVNKRIEACNYIIQNACKDFDVYNQNNINFKKSLLDNIYTYIFSAFGIDEKSKLEYIETTVCNDEFCVKPQQVKLKQLILLDIQEGLINLRKQHNQGE